MAAHCGRAGKDGVRPPNTREVLSDLRRSETMRPLLLVCGFFFLLHFSGVTGMRPYMVQVFQEFGVSLDPSWAAVVTSVIAIVATTVCVLAVPWTGKRPLSLVSQVGVSMSALLLGFLALYSPEGISWPSETLFVFLFFFHSLALAPTPWMLISEVFPLSTRGFASGLAAAFYYVCGFVASKTFVNIKSVMHLHGVFLLYGVISAAGVVFLYFCLYETEGKTLESIEEHYKNLGISKQAKMCETNLNGHSEKPALSFSSDIPSILNTSDSTYIKAVNFDVHPTLLDNFFKDHRAWKVRSRNSIQPVDDFVKCFSHSTLPESIVTSGQSEVNPNALEIDCEDHKLSLDGDRQSVTTLNVGEKNTRETNL